MLFTKKNFEWHFLTKPVNMIINPSLLFTRYLVQARAGFAIHWTHN